MGEALAPSAVYRSVTSGRTDASYFHLRFARLGDSTPGLQLGRRRRRAMFRKEWSHYRAGRPVTDPILWLVLLLAVLPCPLVLANYWRNWIEFVLFHFKLAALYIQILRASPITRLPGTPYGERCAKCSSRYNYCSGLKLPFFLSWIPYIRFTVYHCTIAVVACPVPVQFPQTQTSKVPAFDGRSIALAYSH